MNRLPSRPFAAVAAVVAATLGIACAAHARGDVQVSVGIHSPPVYAPPVRVYEPAPVYAPVVVQPAPVYRTYPSEPVYERPYRGWEHRRHYRERTRWDVDGDGIPNRHDRLYNPRWDVDGDGIPNRRDPVYDPRRGHDHGHRWHDREWHGR